MDLPIIDNTSAYIDVCNKAGLPINKVPKKGDKIDLAYEMSMKEYNPHLYQNITQPDPSELPADVLLRYNAGNLWTEDVAPLERAGFTGSAANMRKQIEEGRRIIEEQKLAEMKARNDARDKAIREKPQGFHPTKNISFNDPSAVKARRDWGLSDDIGLGA